MLQVDNKTPFVVHISPFPDEEGIDTIYPVIKGTFSLNGKVSLAAEQVPLVIADEYNGEPGRASLLYASEALPDKTATDVLLLGHAYAPRHHPAEQVDVSLHVNGRGKTVRVFGDRYWKNGMLGLSPTKPVPFDKIPLIYERAFGGIDISKKGDELSFSHNTAGVGFHHPKGSKNPVGTPLPNLEDARHLVVRPQNKPIPTAFAPLSPNWMPRLQYVGTYDEAWQENRSPYLPDDFDRRFYNVAPPELIFGPYLTGGEEVGVKNASVTGSLHFYLPRIELDVTMAIDGELEHVNVNLDTICIEPDNSRLTMVWRGKCRCDKKTLKMEVATFRVKRADLPMEGH